MQFHGAVSISQIKLLAHETKIPAKIELYSFMPGVDGQADPQYGVSGLVNAASSSIMFRRLGHFSLDSNENSGYMSRELKTVHLGVTCSFFKLVLHRNHENNYNMFNQVALVKLQFLGRQLGDYEIQQLAQANALNPQQTQR